MNPVVITGMGAISAYGVGVEALLNGVGSKRSAIESSDLLAGHPCDLAAMIPTDFVAAEHLPPKLARKMDRSQAIGAIAAQEAIRSALGAISVDEQCGLFMGSAFGPLESVESSFKLLKSKRNTRYNPVSLLRFQFNGLTAWPAIQHNLRGPNEAVAAFQASGLITVGQAARYIREGQTQQMVAGAADTIREEVHVALTGAGAIHSDPTTPPGLRAFDENARGTILGEGAGAFFLEDEARAAERDAVVHAQVLGMGQAHTGCPPDRTSVDPSALVAAIGACLVEAEMAPENIELIVATGSGIPAEDRVEADAIALALGDQTAGTPILALKGYTGHTMGASGVLEAMIAIHSARKGLLPPTPGLKRPISSLEYLLEKDREHRARLILTLAHGIGGHCAALLLRIP